MSNHIEQFPTLNNCINSIKTIGYDRNCQGSKEQATLFTSCLALAYHIALDRERIESLDCKSIPVTDEIPAISAILRDQKLFKIFLSMLSSRASTSNTDDGPTRPPSRGNIFRGTSVQSTKSKSNLFGQSHQQHNNVGKKRSLSTDETPNKSLKTGVTKSPMRTGKDYAKIHVAGAAPSLPSLNSTPNSIIDVNFAVLAAVIFYSSCQYLNQWPAIFVKMFAEDSFGPRIWVDDERCKLFVENLATILEPIQEDTSPNINNNEVEKFVRAFDNFISADETCTPDAPPHQPIHQQLRSVESSTIINAGSDSDSGDEEYVIELTSGSSQLTERMPRYPDSKRFMQKDDEDSSSGEEESNEEIVISSASFGNSNIVEEAKNNRPFAASPIPSQTSGISEIFDWWDFYNTDALGHVRCRYFCSNMSRAHSLIGQALSSRLGERVKQNSSLLMTLPKFMSVPEVRSIAALQLQRWLQSPALSGLARTLFSKLVGEIKNIDPPLRQDELAIKSILGMSLKANQFQMHVENVIQIVKSVPTISTCQQVVLHLLTEELKTLEDGKVPAVSEKSDNLEMLKAVLTRTSSELAHNSLASSIFILLYKSSSEVNGKPRIHLVCNLLGKTVKMLRGWYDGVLMVKMTLMASDTYPDNVDLYSTARIVYECISLIVPTFEVKSAVSNQLKKPMEEEKRYPLIAKFLEVKKVILTWFLRSFGLQGKGTWKQFETREPQRPDYGCVLDGETQSKLLDSTLKILHYLLFLVQPGDVELLEFLGLNYEGNGTNSISPEDLKDRVELCHKYGRDVDEELLRIVLDATNSEKSIADPTRALELVEHMMYNCIEGSGAKFQMNDCSIIWDLYVLSEHRLKDCRTQRVACPGLWWRVTVIALVFCGGSPGRVGATMWKEHPTLRALIKMTVSGRYRFPTVDCNEEERENVKLADYKLRDCECEIVKSIFFPETESSPKSKIIGKEKIEKKSSSRGTRTSARQRAKQERILAIERQEELVREQAEKQRMKRMLRVAQKSVMLWDPRSVARKPPKDSVPLILSVASMFGLRASLIGCTSPDFILKTIGSTSRDGIERAYQWLIPVISSFPSVIDRLPPSASCFLLLRAYGKENNDTDYQLLELSSPLLTHVRKCLVGEYGAEGVKRSADLLFFDISDDDPDRRRCARRVLLEALGKHVLVDREFPASLGGEFVWLVTMLDTKFSDVIAMSAIQHISSALFLERGEILHAYAHALQYYERLQLSGSSGKSHPRFSSNIFELLSTRPHICCAAMDRHADLRELFVQTVCNGFKGILDNANETKTGDVKMIIRIKDDALEFSVPSTLLQASVVLISNWDQEVDDDLTDEFMSLTRYLIQSKDRQELCEGAASATYTESGKRAVSVEEWVALAKSRCDFVARESVLSAPDIFLPRLLLCCGLPECSFSSIIDRLDRYGETSVDIDKCYGQLFSSSATCEWGLGHGLRRSLVMRKLYGRVMAYTNLLRHMKTSSPFITWISQKCMLNQEKSVSKKGNNTTAYLSKNLTTLDVLNGMLSEIQPLELPVEQNKTSAGLKIIDASPSTLDLPGKISPGLDISYLRDNWNSKNAAIVENLLGGFYTSSILKTVMRTQSNNHCLLETSKELLQLLHASREKNPMIKLSIKWAPVFSSSPDSSFFELLFLYSEDWPSEVQEGKEILVARCFTSWSVATVHACQRWIIGILKSNQEHRKYCTKFMLHSFTWHSPNVLCRDQFACTEPSIVDRIQSIQIQDVDVLTELALSLANDSSIGVEILSEPWDCDDEWAFLLFLIGRKGKTHLEAMVKILVKNSAFKGWNSRVIPALLLKIYSSFPDTMNLGDASIREILVNASICHHDAWLECSTPIDDQISSAINRLDITMLQKQQQLVKDFTKRYPLFVLKHINGLYDILNKDATQTSRRDIERGRQVVHYPTLVANSNQNATYQVTILHWGSSFSEPLWVAVLDILLSFPEQVLYNCGHLMGFLDILNLYLTLFKAQVDVTKFRTHRIDSSSIQRTSNKFCTILLAFKARNCAAYNEWIQFAVISSGRVMDIIRECQLQL